MQQIGRELVGLWWRPEGTEGRLTCGVKLIRVWRGCIYTKVYWAGLFILITGPHRLLRFFRLTEPKNRINLTYFGYLKLETELGTETFGFGLFGFRFSLIFAPA